VNTDLLTRTLAYIEDHPREWNQGAWAVQTSCGTAYCFAGTAVHLAQPDAEFNFDDGAPRVAWSVNDRPVGASAAELLGLSEDDADRLFEPGNTLTDLRREVARLVQNQEMNA